MANTFNHFPQLAAKLKPALQQGIKTTAKEIVTYAAGTAPRETGFMADNVYYSANGESTYGQGPSPSKSGSYLLPEVTPAGDMEAVVGAAANYSIYVEFGHHVHNSTTYVPADPWFFPAVDASQATFEAEMLIALQNALGGP